MLFRAKKEIRIISMEWHKKAMSSEVMSLIVIIILALLLFGIIVYGMQKKFAPLSP